MRGLFSKLLRFLINSIVSVFGINLTFVLFFSDFRSRIVSQGMDPYPERKQEGREVKKQEVLNGGQAIKLEKIT